MPEQTSIPLKIKGLSVDYGDGAVLRDFSGTVSSQAFVSVLGASGCGKSTLLRAISGFVRPARGSVAIGGRVVVDGPKEMVPAEARGVGMVFQDYALFAHMDVAANIGFGVPSSDRRQRVKELLALVDLSGLEDRRPAELSGGQQQRVALARALAPRPTLLLLDEPFANVDAKLRRELASELRRMLRNEGAATLMVTHDREEALALADEVLVLGTDPAQASLRQRGTPREVYEQPASPEIAELTGYGACREAKASGTRAETFLGEFELARTMTGRATILFRPEDLVFEIDDAGPLRVESRRFEGRGWKLAISDDRGMIELDWAERDAPEPGTLGRVKAIRPLWAWPK